MNREHRPPQHRQPEWGIIFTLIFGLATWAAFGWWLSTY